MLRYKLSFQSDVSPPPQICMTHTHEETRDLNNQTQQQSECAFVWNSRIENWN